MKRFLLTAGTVIGGVAFVAGADYLLTMNIHDHDTAQVVSIFFGLLCGIPVGLGAALVWDINSGY